MYNWLFDEVWQKETGRDTLQKTVSKRQSWGIVGDASFQVCTKVFKVCEESVSLVLWYRFERIEKPICWRANKTADNSI